eukprot:365718-Chlamydomonas_euryale.AAC.18
MSRVTEYALWAWQQRCTATGRGHQHARAGRRYAHASATTLTVALVSCRVCAAASTPPILYPPSSPLSLCLSPRLPPSGPSRTCTRQSMSSALTCSTAAIRDRSTHTPPCSAAMWPSSEVPAPNGSTGTR